MDGATGDEQLPHGVDGTVVIYFARGVLPAGAYRIRAETRAPRVLLAGASRLAYFRVKADD